MSDDVTDVNDGDEPWFTQETSGHVGAVEYCDEMTEVVETLEREQKILAKIVCVPGKTTYVAAWMKKYFEIILEVDAKAQLRTNTGKVIKRLEDFPVGQKFSDAFKPVQSDDTKSVKIVFYMTSTPTLSSIKNRYRKLVDHLQANQIYMDESFSGSDEEEIIGYFMGFQADKTYVTGFSDDLREMITRMTLQPGELHMLAEAKRTLTWSPTNACPPFYARVRNVTRVHAGSQYTSKAIGISTAKEHSAFFKTLLIRAQDEKQLNGLGRYINSPTDRSFYKAIKWHNDQIDPTSIIPILGLSRTAMLHPLQAQLPDRSGSITTTIRDELINSGKFCTIHSTKQTFSEGRWILVVSDKNKVKEAGAFFTKLVQSMYGGKNGQIPIEARNADMSSPSIEEKSQTEHRYRSASNQPNAWGSTFSSENKIEGGSRLRNMPIKNNKKRQTRRVVELSFDPESISEFPDLQTQQTNRNTGSRSVNSAKSTKSNKSAKSNKSNASSESGSAVSAVTRADFTNLAEGLSKDISKMIRDEYSVLSANSDASSMINILKDELVEGRKRQDRSIQLMEHSMQLMSAMMNQLVSQTKPPPASQSTTTNAPFSASAITDTATSNASNTPQSPTSQQPQRYDVPPFNSGGAIIKSQRRVTIDDAPMKNHDDYEHPTPASTGATPPPKKPRGTNATSLQRKLDESFANTTTTKQPNTDSEGTVGGGS